MMSECTGGGLVLWMYLHDLLICNEVSLCQLCVTWELDMAVLRKIEEVDAYTLK